MLRAFQCGSVLMLAGWSLGFSPVVLADEAAERLTLAVDALTRLEGIDLSANSAMKDRVMLVLGRTRGTANFVRLVRHFRLEDQEAGLVEVAGALPRDESGVEAVRLLLTQGRTNALVAAVAKNDPASLNLIEALGNCGHRDAMKLLLPILRGLKETESAKGNQLVRALTRSADGAQELLTIVKTGSLPEPTRRLALDELAQTRWPTTKNEAMTLRADLRLKEGQGVVKWPPVAELVQMTGDGEKGQSIYFRASPGCYNCHVVQGRGVDLGPNLTEIGSKLPKEALFQAILEPSAGISFGYEAFSLTFKDGEEAYGLIASETANELSLKTIGGVMTRYQKADIASRQKSTLSLMPAGLEAGVTPQELVDLVAYLSSLKKAGE
jgi:putative heme-binding domain-containing protein